MFKAYELYLDSDDFDALTSHYEDMKVEIFELRGESQELGDIQKELSRRIIDGTKIINSWFPAIQADIFISHSHNDIDLAFALSHAFSYSGLKAFVDSDIWGSADNLLRSIDNQYCRHETNSDSYSYEKRNFSTSHVHAMLSSAIMEMIDKAECLIFLNTPNSITVDESVVKKTNSPWLFLEHSIGAIIKPVLRRRSDIFSHVREGTSVKAAAADSALNIEYKLTKAYAKKINLKTITRARQLWLRSKSRHPLDVLYQVADDS